MDTEGTTPRCCRPRGPGIQTFPNQEPRFAAAMARAYNDWLHDFCSANPNRLLGAGMISVYDIDDALRATRRVAEEYQFRSVFLRANIVNGKNWYDPYYEPLWNLLEELNLPLGFHEASASPRQAAEHFDPTSASAAFTRNRSSK
jgi:predicted TIM-barrel fold metal-dependent hydrolase